MKCLLDTSVVISRVLFKSKVRKAVNSFLGKVEPVVTTYIVGEFRRTVIRDVVFLRNVIHRYGLGEALHFLARLPRTRRVSNIFNLLGLVTKISLDGFEIIDILDLLRMRLEEQCFDGVKMLDDGTECYHSRVLGNMSPDGFFRISFPCRNCRITNFIKENLNLLKDLKGKLSSDLGSLTASLIQEAGKSGIRWRTCRKTSDLIIVLIAKVKGISGVASLNEKDFKEICAALKVKFVNPIKFSTG